MTNAFEVGVERHGRELKKPDMVEAIADKLLEDHIALMAPAIPDDMEGGA